jgi:hypothetical protein
VSEFYQVGKTLHLKPLTAIYEPGIMGYQEVLEYYKKIYDDDHITLPILKEFKLNLL